MGDTRFRFANVRISRNHLTRRFGLSKAAHVEVLDKAQASRRSVHCSGKVSFSTRLVDVPWCKLLGLDTAWLAQV